ncbi:Ben and cat operon transcriptional regulator [Serratia quinivorans]|uniref:LysR family transcriptional regulator n=1 Tax=Serratia quinivorans TaxID=137545 RepID=UPI00217BA79C|nr:LysR family transcriptional regulator [Serratia quinivorans]CAI1913989.1 Ben and cat operon transcriptional regulator [Serratia quinivorans]
MIFSRQTKQFITVVKNGSYAKAAEEISITPSALSHGIRDLEFKLGKKLLIRSKAGVILTHDGDFFYKEISPLYNHGNQVIKEWLDDNGSERESIIIKTDGLPYPSITENIGVLLTEFTKKISIIKDDYAALVDGINIDECDIIVQSFINRPTEKTEDLYRLALPPEKIGIMVREDVLQQHGSISRVLEREALIQCSSALAHPVYKNIQKNMKSHGLSSVFIGLPEISDVQSAVINGLGASLVAEGEMKQLAIENSGLKFIDSPFPFDMYVHGNIYFKRERFEELVDIAMCLQGNNN